MRLAFFPERKIWFSFHVWDIPLVVKPIENQIAGCQLCALGILGPAVQNLFVRLPEA
jgi:hypothetical protein